VRQRTLAEILSAPPNDQRSFPEIDNSTNCTTQTNSTRNATTPTDKSWIFAAACGPMARRSPTAKNTPAPEPAGTGSPIEQDHHLDDGNQQQ